MSYLEKISVRKKYLKKNVIMVGRHVIIVTIFLMVRRKTEA